MCPKGNKQLTFNDPLHMHVKTEQQRSLKMAWSVVGVVLQGGIILAEMLQAPTDVEGYLGKVKNFGFNASLVFIGESSFSAERIHYIPFYIVRYYIEVSTSISANFTFSKLFMFCFN